ncbi:MAG: putative transposase [Streptomyces sp.]|nr:putative transposase [Streptomyces sp.]
MIREVFDGAYQSYGYRRVRMTLQRKHGVAISGKTVLKLMRQEGCRPRVRRRKYRPYIGEVGKAAPNLLARDFAATAPDQKWVTDVTEFTVAGTRLFLSPLIDLFNGEVLSYTVATAPTMALVMDMLVPALSRLQGDARPTIHSDQGWHYRHRQYTQALLTHGATQSMSRKGNCLDNAVAENFFSHLKEEFIRRRQFGSVPQFRAELDAYMHWFNNHRIREKLGGLSPIQYRAQLSADPPPDRSLIAV